MNRPNASAGRPALRRAAWAAAAAGLALCLALPALLCGAETAALERGTLARPALESTLTAEGQEAVDRGRRERDEWLRSRIGATDDAERRTLWEAAQILHRNLVQRRD